MLALNRKSPPKNSQFWSSKGLLTKHVFRLTQTSVIRGDGTLCSTKRRYSNQRDMSNRASHKSGTGSEWYFTKKSSLQPAEARFDVLKSSSKQSLKQSQPGIIGVESYSKSASNPCLQKARISKISSFSPTIGSGSTTKDKEIQAQPKFLLKSTYPTVNQKSATKEGVSSTEVGGLSKTGQVNLNSLKSAVLKKFSHLQLDESEERPISNRSTSFMTPKNARSTRNPERLMSGQHYQVSTFQDSFKKSPLPGKLINFPIGAPKNQQIDTIKGNPDVRGYLRAITTCYGDTKPKPTDSPKVSNLLDPETTSAKSARSQRSGKSQRSMLSRRPSKNVKNSFLVLQTSQSYSQRPLQKNKSEFNLPDGTRAIISGLNGPTKNTSMTSYSPINPAYDSPDVSILKNSILMPDKRDKAGKKNAFNLKGLLTVADGSLKKTQTQELKSQKAQNCSFGLGRMGKQKTELKEPSESILANRGARTTLNQTSKNTNDISPENTALTSKQKRLQFEKTIMRSRTCVGGRPSARFHRLVTQNEDQTEESILRNWEGIPTDRITKQMNFPRDNSSEIMHTMALFLVSLNELIDHKQIYHIVINHVDIKSDFMKKVFPSGVLNVEGLKRIIRKRKLGKGGLLNLSQLNQSGIKKDEEEGPSVFLTHEDKSALKRLLPDLASKHFLKRSQQLTHQLETILQTKQRVNTRISQSLTEMERQLSNRLKICIQEIKDCLPAIVEGFKKECQRVWKENTKNIVKKNDRLAKDLPKSQHCAGRADLDDENPLDIFHPNNRTFQQVGQPILESLGAISGKMMRKGEFGYDIISEMDGKETRIKRIYESVILSVLNDQFDEETMEKVDRDRDIGVNIGVPGLDRETTRVRDAVIESRQLKGQATLELIPEVEREDYNPSLKNFVSSISIDQIQQVAEKEGADKETSEKPMIRKPLAVNMRANTINIAQILEVFTAGQRNSET